MFTPCVLIDLKTALEVIASRVFSLYFYKTSDFMALQLYSLTHLHIKDTITKFETYITRKRTAWPRSQIPIFMFLCAIYTFPWLVCIFCLQKKSWIDRGNIYITHRHMNVEIGTEAAQFLFRQYISRNLFAVCFVLSVHRLRLVAWRIS